MMRAAFFESAEFFASVVERVDDDGWEKPGLGEWSVRELAGHTYRSIANVLSFTAELADAVVIDSPVTHFVVGFDRGDPKLVAERGRAASLEIKDDPLPTVRASINLVRSKLDELEDSAILTTPNGGMRLEDYLATRILELTIHTLDLAKAIGVEAEPPASSMKVTLDILSGIAVQRGVALSLVLAAAGRASLPSGFKLMG